MTTLSILGAGRIGGEVAYLSVVTGLVDRLVIYDAQKEFLRAQVLDLLHTGADIEVSTHPMDTRESDICVFSAGIPRDRSMKTRADLLSANMPVANECCAALAGFSGVLVAVTNPMDPNTYLLQRKSGLDRSRCIGFGGQVDSARFRLALKERDIAGDAYVIGEHGEHQVPLFSRLPVPVLDTVRNHILADLRGSSMEIIKGKGGTVFGPAWHIYSLIRAIAEDRDELFTCSCILDGEYGQEKISIGVPARIGREGVHEIIEWDLDEWERKEFDEAARFVRTLCSACE